MQKTLPSIKPQQQQDQIVSFIKKTFADAGKTTAIVAVSGGIDSATTLSLTTSALGPQNTHALLLPSLQTEEKHLGDAHKITNHLQIPTQNVHEINLAGIQDMVSQTLRLYTKQSPTDDRIGNIAARIRMILIYDQAKAKDALVVGTENKSEHLLAYYTRYGDEASDLEPIKHLYKSQVYELAVHLGIPEAIITKKPTAGLWKDQTDEDELGFSYAQADPILYFHFDDHKSAEDIEKLGYDQKIIQKILKHCQKIDFKHHVPYTLDK